MKKKKKKVICLAVDIYLQKYRFTLQEYGPRMGKKERMEEKETNLEFILDSIKLSNRLKSRAVPFHWIPKDGAVESKS